MAKPTVSAGEGATPPSRLPAARILLAALLVGGGAAAGSLAPWAVHRPVRQQAAQPGGDDEDLIGPLREEVHRLAAEVKTCQRLTMFAAGSVERAGGAVRSPGERGGGAPAADPGGGEPAAPLADAEVLRRVGERFEAEAVNLSWARDAEAAARRQLTSSGGGPSHLKELECRSTMCRGRLVYRNQEELDRLTIESMTSPARDWIGVVSRFAPEPLSDGSVALNVVLSTAGTDVLAEVQRDDRSPPPR